MLMGIGWGLCHRKIARVPKYLNHQSPQPNSHTFFYIIKYEYENKCPGLYSLNFKHFIIN